MSLVSAVPTGLTITSPNEGQGYGTAVNSMGWSFDLGSLNLSSDKCWYQLNGNDWTEFDCSQNPITNLAYNQGDNIWKIEINDSLSSVEETRNFWVDSIEPNLNNINPTSNMSYTNKNIFNFQFWLNETNKDFSYDGNVLRLVLWKPGSSTHIWSNDINMSSAYLTDAVSHTLDSGNKKEGDYNYIAYASDIYPNGTIIRESQLNGVIIRDTINPTISIDSPINNATLKDNFLIEVSANDERSGINLILINVSQGDLTNSTSCSSSPCYFDWQSKEFAEGQVNITSTATDKAGNSNQTSITIEIDNTAPEIYFNSPGIGAYNSAQVISITSDDVHFQQIDLYVNNSLVNTSTTKELNHTLGEGQYLIYAIATDTFENSNQTENRSIIIDLTAPVITLIEANPQTIEFGENYIEFNATVSDNFDGDVSSNLIIDSSEINVGAEGVYSVYYNVNDSVNNTATAIRTVIINDTIGPTISLISPEKNQPFAFDDNDIIFNFDDPFDFSYIPNCSLILDDIIQETIVQGEGWPNFKSITASVGMHTWSITCIDNSNNQNSATSETRSFTILSNLSESSEFEESTNLTAEPDISNVEYFFVAGLEGTINWTEPIDFSSGFDWSQFINISNNRIEVNSTGAPELNKSAIITLYNLTSSNPRILINGAVCSSDVCTKISYNVTSGTLVFTVTGFSIYTTEETPVTPETPSSSSGGGGGGSCTTVWMCSEWSDCLDGTQTRTCEKSNSNCIAGDKPSESQSCLISLEEPTQEEEDVSEETPQTEGLSGITGAIIGVLSTTTSRIITIIIALGALAALYYYVVIKKKKLLSKTIKNIEKELHLSPSKKEDMPKVKDIKELKR